MGEVTGISWTEAEKEAAQQFVNIQVKFGLRPHPNTLPCTDCAHVWYPGQKRHEYHHYAGYAEDAAFKVVPLCTICHHDRHHVRVTHCKHGHEFTETNTHFRKNGTRECKSCRRIQKKRQRPATWWRERRLRKKGISNG